MVLPPLLTLLVACPGDLVEPAEPETAAEPADDAGAESPDPGAAVSDPGAEIQTVPEDAAPRTTPDLVQADDMGVEDAPAPKDVEEAEDIPVDVGSPAATFDPAAVTEDLVAFNHGIRTGDPHPDGVQVVTRFGGEAAAIRVVAWLDDNADLAVVAAETTLIPNDGGFVSGPLNGLDPYTVYRLTAVALDAADVAISRSRLGRFTTAPTPDALVPVVFGGTSCSKQLYKPFLPLGFAADDALDFFVMGGDTTYADGANNLSEYRVKWAEALLDGNYLDLMAETSVVATWDDHEVENNWDPEKENKTKVTAARAAFFEHLPTRSPNGEQVIWRSMRWGRTVEVFVLDTRSERKPSTIFSQNPIYISEAQMSWLKTSLLDSDAVFKIIVNSVPITEMPALFLTTWDRWAGYAAQRQELLSHILDDVDGTVVFLSGDFHFPATTHVGKPGSAENVLREILMGPTGHIINPLSLTLQSNPSDKAQFPYSGVELNYTRFSADPTAEPPTLTVEYVTGTGDVVHTEVIEAGQ